MKTSKFIEKIWRITVQSVTCKLLFEMLLANVCKRHLTKSGVLNSYTIAGTQA
ncbi:hypothetical protein KKH3_00730 [Pectobacterium actinidiae]|nr:hypothetical protein KKH3_00730 [Pectobacterium actinidiae]